MPLLFHFHSIIIPLFAISLFGIPFCRRIVSGNPFLFESAHFIVWQIHFHSIIIPFSFHYSSIWRNQCFFDSIFFPFGESNVFLNPFSFHLANPFRNRMKSIFDPINNVWPNDSLRGEKFFTRKEPVT